MQKIYEKIECLILRQEWADEFESLENPKLLANQCLFVAEEMLKPTFNVTEFSKLVEKDTFMRELFRVTFFYALVLREHRRVQNESERHWVENNPNELDFWRKMFLGFATEQPIFDVETFWNVIEWEDFKYEYSSTTFEDMFASIIVYVLEDANKFMEILRNIVAVYDEHARKLKF